MKSTPMGTNARNAKGNGVRQPAKLLLLDNQSLLSRTRTERHRIQWPTREQIQDVSKHLARIGREGRRCELAGDYFASGDLAYQLHEILRITRELLTKSQRTKM